MSRNVKVEPTKYSEHAKIDISLNTSVTDDIQINYLTIPVEAIDELIEGLTEYARKLSAT